MEQKSLSEVNATVHTDKSTPWKRFLSFAGPAYLISVGYMDPGNWATDIAGGSAFGYKLIWVLLASNLIALLLQSLSARLGVVGGLDLAQASKKVYPSWANIPLYILAEIAIAACDLAEIVGMAIGLNLVFGLPLIWGISISALDTIFLLYLLKKGMRIMEIVIISLIFIIGLSFLIEMIIVKPVIGDVLQGFIPSNLDGSALYIAIGIIGATVMPHNLYLHSSLVQTRKIDPSFKGIKRALKYNFIDSAIALNLAFFVNAAILILAAAAFYVNGYFNIAEIQDASHLLDNLFGKTAPMFFGIALIASGQSSTITGTLAGQIVMEGHLNLRIQPWLRRLITRLLAIIPALFTIFYFGEQGLGSLLILSQVVLSLQLGFAIIPLIHFNSDKILMREFAIKPWVKILAWTSAVLIVYLNVRLVIEEIGVWMDSSENHLWIYTMVIPIVLASMGLLIYIFVYPIISPKMKEKKQLPHGYAKKIVLSESIDYKRIGIAIDFSGNDQVLIQNALRQGGKSAKYTFIHVVETAAARYLGRNALDNETKLDEQNIRIYQNRLIELGYTADYQIGFGSPAAEIVKIVIAQDLDFLVLGSHGHKELKDLVFGTTVDKVRHRIQIPLLIVYK